MGRERVVAMTKKHLLAKIHEAGQRRLRQKQAARNTPTYRPSEQEVVEARARWADLSRDIPPDDS